MRRLLFALLFIAVLNLSGPMLNVASACPMCKQANESDENRPKAYMYSILFMLSMPAVIFTGFGIGFYRLHCKQANVESAEDTF